MKRLESSPLADRPLAQEDADRIYRLYPELPRSAHDGCPTCRKNRGKGRDGVILWRGDEWECNCQDQLQRAKHYLNAGVGDIYQRLDWSDWVVDDAPLLKLNERYIANLERNVHAGIGIVATGPNGTGKTMILALILKKLVCEGFSCYMTTFQDLLDSKTYGWRSDEEVEEFRKRVTLSRVLLIDDVGKEIIVGQSNAFQNSLGVNTFDSVLRTRIQGARPTFMTSNIPLSLREIEESGGKMPTASDVTPQTFGSVYGLSALSLLVERSLPIAFKGTDYRPDMNARVLQEVANGETRPIF